MNRPAAPAVVYLVLAHHQPAHLGRLVRALAEDHARFFVHVDLQCSLEPFRRACDGVPGVTFIDRRERVWWGGFSLLRASLNLVEEAAREGARRYCLLSGADFPIKPRARIREVLLGSDREFMGVWRALAGTPRDPRFAFVEDRYFPDHPLFSHRPGVPLAQRLARWPFLRALALVNRALPRRRFPLGWTPYQGSQWWCLTGECIRHVLDVTARHPEYLAFFRRVPCSDEIYFHTIVKNSSFAPRISHDVRPRATQSGDLGCHYVDWDDERNSPSPRVLDESDLEALRRSPSLFARKFDERRSAGLIERLERDVLAAPAGTDACPTGSPT